MSPPTDVPRLPPRSLDSHKGTFGRVLIVAGSRGMSGAAVLCGSAALRGGAGLVQLAVPDVIEPLVAVGNPCYMVRAFATNQQGHFSLHRFDEVIRATGWADVAAIGPGLGQSRDAPNQLQEFLQQVDKPIVVDADGLNALAQIPPHNWPKRSAPIVLTPHPGEFSRLTHAKGTREETATAFARERGVVLVLKGHATIVTDGQRLYTNTTGNPGMATGGTGDVLTGLIAAIIGQGLPAFDAAVLSVWAHGRAGDLAAAVVGQTALIATDLLQYIPAALREIGG